MGWKIFLCPCLSRDPSFSLSSPLSTFSLGLVFSCGLGFSRERNAPDHQCIYSLYRTGILRWMFSSESAPNVRTQLQLVSRAFAGAPQSARTTPLMRQRAQVDGSPGLRLPCELRVDIITASR